ncbi:MAG: SDR family NAD(P)-dependent oxidoreductase [Candidatus Latescibacterota bacterium]|jgi:3-oxoacyl-[acyl-carrier protein] reductase
MLKLDLQDKVAVVTGASGEIGRVIARTLADCGARVVLHYYKGQERAEEVRKEIEAAGGQVIIAQADIADRAAVFSLRDTVTQAFGAADIIVNNAVEQYQWTSILEQDEADYESQFRSSVLHNVLMTKAFVPGMIEKKWGRVIATNTECTMQCNPNQSAYISGKAGQDRVLRVLAREVGQHGITVNQVAPGWMISDKYRDEPVDDSGYVSTVPLGHRGEDQDIANAVAFLASDLASFITGVYLPVAGGNVMPRI